MKDLTEYVSGIVSPFDEGTIDEQVLLNKQGYIQYQQDLIINSISKRENIHNILMFFDSLIIHLNNEKKQIFLEKILNALIEKYFLKYLDFYNQTNNLPLTQQENIIELFKFLETDQYYDFLSSILPSVPIRCNKSKEDVEKFISDNIFIINQQMTQSSVEYSHLLSVFLKYTSIYDFVSFLVILLNKDVLSIVVKQNERKL